MSNSETQASIDVDEFLTTHVYNQFNQFMDYQINKRTSTYKFKFKFEGTELKSNRQFRLDNALKLNKPLMKAYYLKEILREI